MNERETKKDVKMTHISLIFSRKLYVNMIHVKLHIFIFSLSSVQFVMLSQLWTWAQCKRCPRPLRLGFHFIYFHKHWWLVCMLNVAFLSLAQLGRPRKLQNQFIFKYIFCNGFLVILLFFSHAHVIHTNIHEYTRTRTYMESRAQIYRNKKTNGPNCSIFNRNENKQLHVFSFSLARLYQQLTITQDPFNMHWTEKRDVQ